MNEITLHGNCTAEPVLHRGDDYVFITFDIAVNRSYPDPRGGWRELPAIYFKVIARNALAENIAESLHRGTTVTVTGYLADDSFTPAGSDQRVRRQRFEAGDVAVSLRFATARVTKRTPARRVEQPDGELREEPAA